MDKAHKASAVAQIVFYALAVPVTLYVGTRAWKYGPRTAWFLIIAMACVRFAGGIMALAIKDDGTQADTQLLTATNVLLNLGLVPLLMPFHALARIVLEEILPKNKYIKVYMISTRLLLLGAVGLLCAAGSFVTHPDKASTQSILAKVAYFAFVFVLLSLTGIAAWVYFLDRDQIKDGLTIFLLWMNKLTVRNTQYMKWLLITSPIICVRAAVGVISVFEAGGAKFRTSIWSPLFGNAVLFSLVVLPSEYIVVCVFIYLGYHRFSTADQYGLVPHKGLFQRKVDTTKEQGRHEWNSSSAETF